MRQAAVIGLGRFGARVATALAERGFEVLAIDVQRERVAALRDRVTRAVQITATTEEVFYSLGLDKVDVAIVGIGEQVEGSILTTAILKKIGVSQIIARAINKLHGEILALVGADRVVFPEEEMGFKVAVSLTAPSLLDHIELSEGFGIAQLRCPKSLVGRTLRELRLRTRYYVNVVALKRTTAEAPKGLPSGRLRGEAVHFPHPDYRLEENDILVVIGKDEDIERLSRMD